MCFRAFWAFFIFLRNLLRGWDPGRPPPVGTDSQLSPCFFWRLPLSGTTSGCTSHLRCTRHVRYKTQISILHHKMRKELFFLAGRVNTVLVPSMQNLRFLNKKMGEKVSCSAFRAVWWRDSPLFGGVLSPGPSRTLGTPLFNVDNIFIAFLGHFPFEVAQIRWVFHFLRGSGMFMIILG